MGLVYVWRKGDLVPVLPRRDTLLIVARSPDTRQPQIFEVIAPVFDLAATLDNWTDPTAFYAIPGAVVHIAHLARCGLIEARQ